jgi:hypothetical protein
MNPEKKSGLLTESPTSPAARAEAAAAYLNAGSHTYQELTAESLITRNPIPAVVTAFALGFLLSRLLRR